LVSIKNGAWRLVGLGALLVGCAQGSTTAGSALIHPAFPYAVTYDDEEKKSVLGDDWKLENYRRREQSTDIERKDGYELKYSFDFNDDDKSDEEQDLPFPDLVFVNKKTNARLDVSTLLLDERLASKELRLLLNDVVDSRNGTRSLLVGFGRVALGVEKRFASRLLDSSEATLGDQKGLVATIERADIDQLQLDPKARWQRSRLFMMHAPFDYYAAELALTSGAGEPGPVRKYHKYRVLLLVEYTNAPEDFEAQYPEFLRLLNKTHMMSDAMLMAYLAQPLSRCPAREAKATLQVAVSATGEGMLNQAIGVDALCAGDVISIYPFIGTGVDRVLSQEYDFSKPLKPDWLNAPVYREQRVAAASPEAPKPDVAGPATQVPAEPQPQSAAAAAPAEPIAPPPPPPAAAPAPSPSPAPAASP
jgi:hypothetical protein